MPGMRNTLGIPVLAVLLCLLIHPPIIKGSPDEFSGKVLNVKDGDSLLIKKFGSIRLADINCYQLPSPEGREAKRFTEQVLGRTVHLDIDDMGSRCPSGCRICVLYTEFENGSINPICFNRMLVDAGHAVIADRTDNEFDPSGWWGRKDSYSGIDVYHR